MDGGPSEESEQIATAADRWTADVAAGNVGPLKAAFSAHGAEGPTLMWCPAPQDLQPPPLQFLLSYWTGLRKDDGLPRAGDIDPLNMRPALGYVLLLDIVEGGLDFRYRLFGTILAAVSGFEMTGKLMSEHPTSPYILDFYRATYRAALQRREPLATVHSPPVAVSTTIWHRLILPFADRDGAVVRLMGGTVPVSRNGEPLASSW